MAMSRKDSPMSKINLTSFVGKFVSKIAAIFASLTSKLTHRSGVSPTGNPNPVSGNDTSREYAERVVKHIVDLVQRHWWSLVDFKRFTAELNASGQEWTSALFERMLEHIQRIESCGDEFLGKDDRSAHAEETTSEIRAEDVATYIESSDLPIAGDPLVTMQRLFDLVDGQSSDLLDAAQQAEMTDMLNIKDFRPGLIKETIAAVATAREETRRAITKFLYDQADTCLVRNDFAVGRLEEAMKSRLADPAWLDTIAAKLAFFFQEEKAKAAAIFRAANATFDDYADKQLVPVRAAWLAIRRMIADQAELGTKAIMEGLPEDPGSEEPGGEPGSEGHEPADPTDA